MTEDNKQRLIEFVQFAIVGAIGTLADIVVYSLLHNSNLAIATAIGFLTGLTVNYLLNSTFVFKTGRSTTGYGKYFTISVGGFLLTELIVHLLYDGADLSRLMAKLAAVVVVFFWNYGWSKYWVFKN